MWMCIKDYGWRSEALGESTLYISDNQALDMVHATVRLLYLGRTTLQASGHHYIHCGLQQTIWLYQDQPAKRRCHSPNPIQPLVIDSGFIPADAQILSDTLQTVVQATTGFLAPCRYMYYYGHQILHGVMFATG